MTPQPKRPVEAGSREGRRATPRPGAAAAAAGERCWVALAGLGRSLADAARVALAAEGCEIATFASAEALLKRAQAQAFELVVADVAALGLGHGEITRRVKAAAPKALVVLLSDAAPASAPIEALRAGADDYLEKPVSPDALRERLRCALARRRLELSIRQRALQLAFVTEISSASHASLDLGQVLRAAVGDLRALAEFDLAAAVLRGPSGDVAVVHPLTPDAEAVWDGRDRFPLADSVVARDFAGGEPRVVAELGREALTADLACLPERGFRSLALLPLASRGGTVGAFVLASRRPEAFAGSDLDLLRHVGDHLASAVVNARLYGELKSLSSRLEETVRERSREVLEVKQYLENLVETAGDAIITVDRERRVTSWNRGAHQMLGHAKDDMRGQDLCTLASGEGARDQLAALLARALAGEIVSNVETAWVRRDRKEATVSLTVSPIAGRGDRPEGVLAVARDVTERKRLQEELFHSEKLASIGQLAAAVAHQINNPLGAISGRAQMLLRLSGPPQPDFLHEQLGKIHADCSRITETVNDLLGFARKTDTVKQSTDVNRVLDETLDMVRHEIVARKVRIERRFARSLPPIRASANHLRQLFANLATNAFDAMRGGGTLTIATACRMPTRQRAEKLVEISFADTGVGIAREDLTRIFEPFFTTKPPGQGTGLGLAVAKRIVDFHNGRMDVESTLGVGTTFTVHFPVG